MNRPALHEMPVIWDVDGSWRDLYVLNTSLADWGAFLALAMEYPIKYSYDGEQRELPPAAAVREDRDGTHLLQIQTGKVVLKCHFFDESWIELDLDPSEITSGEEHDQVLDFMERLSSALSKPILLTPENSRDTPLLLYDAASESWTRRVETFMQRIHSLFRRH